jgi:hypothetical protein
VGRHGDSTIDAMIWLWGAGFRPAIDVQVDLPGAAITDMTIGGITASGGNGYQTLNLGLHNVGNRLLKPTGRMVITTSTGAIVQRISFKLDTFVPQTEISYPTPVHGSALPAGSYQAAVTLRYGNGKVTRATVPFTITSDQAAQVFRPPLPTRPS